MKPPTCAPAYVQHYLRATEIARRFGYALAIHGTMARDLDVVAVPWTEEAVSAEVLVDELAKEFAWVIRTDEGDQRHMVGPTEKPHGRRAWLIPLMGCALDLSVMPRSTP